MGECCYDSNGDEKNKYTSLEEAEKVTLSRVQNGAVLRIYECEEGGGYHLTSKHLPMVYKMIRLNSLYEGENETYEYSEEEVSKLKDKALDLHKEFTDLREKLETAKNNYQLAKRSFRKKINLTYQLELANNRVLNQRHKYLKDHKK